MPSYMLILGYKFKLLFFFLCRSRFLNLGTTEMWGCPVLGRMFSSIRSLFLSRHKWQHPHQLKWSEVKVTQSCLTLCDPMDSIVHGILQARILEWVAFPFSRGSSQPRDCTHVSHTAGGFLTSWATRLTIPNVSKIGQVSPGGKISPSWARWV